MFDTRRRTADSLSGLNVLITGATGFVGSALLREGFVLNDNFDADIRLSLVIRNKSSRLNKLIDDRRDVSLIESSIGQHFKIHRSFDVVFHCATPASATLNSVAPLEMLNTNFEGMTWILNELRQQKTVPRLVFTSSGAIYGPQPKEMTHIPEGYLGGPDPTQANSAYAEGKRVAEFLLSQAGHRNEVDPVIARLFAFSGQGLPLNTHFALGNFVGDAVSKNRITIRGTGLDTRSYLDSVDMAVWLWAAAAKSEIRSPLHIGSENRLTIRQVADLVALRVQNATKRLVNIEVLGQKSTIDGNFQYVPSTSGTRQILNVDQWTNLETSVDLMINDALKFG